MFSQILRSLQPIAPALKFDPNQPRHPKGTPQGGEFKDTGGGGPALKEHPTPEEFIAARDKSTRKGYLSPLSPDDLKGYTLYMSKDGTVGGAISPDGDMGNLFNNGGPKGAAQEILLQMIADGGKTADAFDGYLPRLYANFGITEVGRMKFNPEYAPPGWDFANDDSPDVIFLAHTGGVGTADDIRQRVRSKEWIKPVPTTNYYDDYDLAKRDALTRAESGRTGSAVLLRKDGRSGVDRETRPSGADGSPNAGGRLDYLSVLKWNESQHPRDEKGQFRGKSTYQPDHDAPVDGEWDWTGVDRDAMVGPGPKWKQQHRQLVADALRSWVGDPNSFRLHSRDALEGAPLPGSGSGKHMRAQAEALLWELENNTTPIPVPLYRGSGARGDLPGTGYSWSETKKIASAFAKRYGGLVEVLPAGTARGLRVRDYTADALGERQWIVRAGNSPVRKYDPQQPRDNQGQWVKDFQPSTGEVTEAEAAEFEELEEAWAGGVADYGDPDAAYAIQEHPKYDAYRQGVVDQLEQEHGTSITVYRAVSEDALKDMEAGSGLGPIGVTTDPELAKSWAKFAPNKDRELVILKTTIEPKIAVMRGKEAESEIVVDGDWISFHQWEEIGRATNKGFVAKKWDESKHPRDKEGQFTEGVTITIPTKHSDLTTEAREYPHGGAAVALIDSTLTTRDEEGSLRVGDAGRLDFSKAHAGFLVVENIYLRPAYRGAGLGKRLYQKALEYAKSKGYQGIASGGEESRRNVVTDRIWERHRTGRRGSYDIMTEWKESTQKKQGSWDESKHPRDKEGQFTEVLHGPRDAMDSLLNKERGVTIDPGDVRKMLELAAELPYDPKEPPNLLHLHVDGMEIFDRTGLGIARNDMPQIPRDHRENFLKEMKAQGVEIVEEWVDPLTLMPSQDEISARNVGQKIAKYEANPKKKFPPLLVSSQDRLLDGHHHWAMMAALAIEFPNIKVPIYRLKVETKRALALMHAYDRKYDIKREDISGAAQKQEHKYGSTHIMIDPWSSAALSLNMARDAIRNEDCMATGKDVDPNHITVRFGLLNEDRIDDLRSFIASQVPFEATVSGIELFSASEHSDGAVPVVARFTSPELHALEAEIDKHATFKEKSFPEYKPHCTLAYVKPEVASLYGALSVRGHCLVHSVTISHQSGTQETIPFGVVRKADATGRYVTPFVSFDKLGNESLRMIASLNSSRLATWGFTAEAEVRGLARYRLTAVLDGRTSKFCRLIDGKVFNTEDARDKVIEVLNVQNPEDLRTVQPWPKQTKEAMAQFAEMTADELVARGLHIPPYHPHCRTLLREVKASAGEEMEETETIPDDVEAFHQVTAADLAELGVTATPEEVEQWNTHVGMSPTELLSKLTGMPPQEVMTKGKGLGTKPIEFEPTGNIAFKAHGDVNGVEFKLRALLDPFTGTYYLTQADLLKGSPKAEVAFLKNLFTSLIEMGQKSTATSVAVGVAGNAAYYAKLGFLPDELEWDSLRRYALEGSTVMPEVLASLAPEDALLVKHLLLDKSVGAMSALVDLPFTYQGKTIGEWLFGEAAGTWALDLTDLELVTQAKAYLSS